MSIFETLTSQFGGLGTSEENEDGTQQETGDFGYTHTSDYADGYDGEPPSGYPGGPQEGAEEYKSSHQGYDTSDPYRNGLAEEDPETYDVRKYSEFEEDDPGETRDIGNDGDNEDTKEPSRPASAQLPDGWVKKFDERYDQWYYLDEKTGRSQWEAPSPAKPKEDAGEDESEDAKDRFGDQQDIAKPVGETDSDDDGSKVRREHDFQDSGIPQDDDPDRPWYHAHDRTEGGEAQGYYAGQDYSGSGGTQIDGDHSNRGYPGHATGEYESEAAGERGFGVDDQDTRAYHDPDAGPAPGSYDRGENDGESKGYGKMAMGAAGGLAAGALGGALLANAMGSDSEDGEMDAERDIETNDEVDPDVDSDFARDVGDAPDDPSDIEREEDLDAERFAENDLDREDVREPEYEAAEDEQREWPNSSDGEEEKGEEEEDGDDDNDEDGRDTDDTEDREEKRSDSDE